MISALVAQSYLRAEADQGTVQTTILADYREIKKDGINSSFFPSSRELNWRNGVNWTVRDSEVPLQHGRIGSRAANSPTEVPCAHIQIR